MSWNPNNNPNPKASKWDLYNRTQCIDTLRQHLPKTLSWLDVGAGTGWFSVELAKHFSGPYECIDNKPRGDIVKPYDGQTLAYDRDAFDMILYSYVLHHVTAEQLAHLMDQSFKIAKTVVMLEDVRDGTAETDALLHKHDPDERFLTQEQWVTVIEQYDGTVKLVEPLHILSGDPYPVPRVLIIAVRNEQHPEQPPSEAG